MSILLPSTPGVRSAKPRFRDFGLTTTPALGGIAQRLDRLGSRWGLDIELPPIGEGAPLRRWNAALLQARHQGALYPVLQPGYASAVLAQAGAVAPGIPGDFAVVSVSGTALVVAGIAAGLTIPAYSAISILSAGVRYTYFTNAPTAAPSITTTLALAAAHQPGDLVQIYGGAQVQSVSGTALTLQLPPTNQVIAAGTFLSVLHGPRRYLHMATADTFTGSGGVCTVAIWPLPRAPYTQNDPVELVTPLIDGLLSGNGFDWTYGLDPYVTQTFSIDEVA